MTLRKRGGQPGNQNAVTHGRHSKPQREQRAAKRAEAAEKHAAWLKTIPATDYGAICDRIKQEKTNGRS